MTAQETSGIIAAQAKKQIAKNENSKTLQAYVKAMEDQIKRALPSFISPERFTRMVLTAISSNPALQQCTPQSFLGAMMTAAQLGLEPNTPLEQAFLIPHRNTKNGTLECQFQFGYKGLIDLAYRSGMVSTVEAHTVHEKDFFELQYGLNENLKHIPALVNPGKAVCYYALIKFKDGRYSFRVIPFETMKEFAKQKSPLYNKGAWQTDFDEMAKKTVLKKALKYAPMTSEFAKALTQDGAVKTEIDADMYSVPAEEEVVYAEVDENGEVQE